MQREATSVHVTVSIRWLSEACRDLACHFEATALVSGLWVQAGASCPFSVAGAAVATYCPFETKSFHSWTDPQSRSDSACSVLPHLPEANGTVGRKLAFVVARDRESLGEAPRSRLYSLEESFARCTDLAGYYAATHAMKIAGEP